VLLPTIEELRKFNQYIPSQDSGPIRQGRELPAILFPAAARGRRPLPSK
jgi:hypothetical protein